MRPLALDTIGKLDAYGYGLSGWCCRCARLYRMSDPPERRPRSAFEIDMASLMAERGADCAVTKLAPVPCPRCLTRHREPHQGAGEISRSAPVLAEEANERRPHR